MTHPKMRVCYIYREKERKEHSIEAVFDTIAQNIDSSIEIEKWYKPKSWKATFAQLRQLRKREFDCYHITGEVYYLWPFLPWDRTVMTVHDIGMYKNNPWSVKRWLFVFLSIFIPSFIHKKIVCVSDLTRNDLINRLHINPKRLLTIHNPLTLDAEKRNKKFNQACPTILQIGTGVHKNLDNLIVSVTGMPCRLDIIGEPDQELIQMMKDREIIFSISHHISKEELIRHYQQCDILYFVSRSEGFGLPILEAQALGRPVITANAEPMKSVAGDGAVFCQAEDPAGIRCGLEQLTHDKQLREECITNGYKNITRFFPEKIAGEYARLYKSY